MKTPTNIRLLGQLGRALAVCALAAASPALMAQDTASQQEQASPPAQAQQSEPLKPESANTQLAPARSSVTGSHIARVRKEPSLPLVVLDRSYIDQSGTTTSRELIQTVPQAQSFGR
jgi:hypothetical protein